jgi:putative peptidoglycan lipid II flippase
VVILGIWGAPFLINIIAIGFKSNMYKYQLAINLTRIIFPYIGFVAVAALFMGILNSYDHFLVPALSPVMLNISVIVFALTLSYKYGIFAIAWGVILGGIGQALIQAPVLIRKKIKYSFVVDFNDPGTKQLLKLLVPVMIGLAITQINVIVDRTIASTLIDGSISALLLFITVPSAVGLIVLKDSLIRLIYEHGIFSRAATNMTASALLYYSIGLFAYACVRLITMSFYALKDTKTPVKIGIYIVFINIALDLILIRYLAHSGLALATSVAAILNLIILLKVLQNKIGDMELKSQAPFLIKIIISSIFLGIICVLVNNYFGSVLDLSNKYNQTIQVIVSIFSGGMVYLMSNYILGVKEVRNLKQSIKTILRSRE